MSTFEMVLSPRMILATGRGRRQQADCPEMKHQLCGNTLNRFRVRIILQLVATAAAMQFFPEIRLTGPFPGIGDVAVGPLDVSLTMLVSLVVMNAIHHVARRYGVAGIAVASSSVAVAVLSSFHAATPLMLLCLACAALQVFHVLAARSNLVAVRNVIAELSGFVLAMAVLALPGVTGGELSPLVSLAAVAMPVCVTVSVALGRLAAGRSPFIADCLPVSAAGRNEGIMVSLSLVFPLLAVTAAVLKVSDTLLFISLAGLCVAYHAVSRRPETSQES